jgi:hypothetical protein
MKPTAPLQIIACELATTPCRGLSLSRLGTNEHGKFARLGPWPEFHSTAQPLCPLGEDFPVVAARLVDKCRAELLGQSGSYQYDCPLDRMFFAASGLETGPLREFIATGADDNDVAAWMKTHVKVPKEKLIKWGRRFRMNPLWNFLVFEDWLHRFRHRDRSS